MKTKRVVGRMRGFWQTAVVAVALCLTAAAATDAGAAGLLKSTGGSDEGVVISSHKVDVTINNGFARTEVDQVFVNTTDRDMEAVYTLPLPKEASMSELSLWINGAEVIGEVLEKERAREVYNDQKAKGNDTAIAEKDDFKAFKVSVGNVRAGDEARVRVVYYQPVEIDLNIGRYVYPLAEGGVDEEQLAFWSVDDHVSGPFSFKLTLKSAFPVKGVRLPGLQNEAVITHSSVADEDSAGDIYDVVIDREAGSTLSSDIVFYYRLDDTVPARVELVPYKATAEGEGTFMVVVTPAADLQAIDEGTDWTFVLDVSGSMSGHKIATLADGVARVIGKMDREDRFRIVTFNNSARDFSGGFVNATAENVNSWVARVKTIQAGGGTNLYSGLKKGYRGMDDDRTTAMILVTDGVSNVGYTEQRDFVELLKKYDVRLFTFVIGNSANQPLLDRIANVSGGFAMNVSDSDDIGGRIMMAKAKVLSENMHGVKLTFGGEKVTDLTPIDPGPLYLGEQLIAFGHYRGSGEVKITMKAKISGEEKKWVTTAMLPEVDTDNPELERMWALSKVDETMAVVRDKGETSALRKKIVDLGVAYSLVTDYTSMVVVSDDVFEEYGIDRKNATRVEKERVAHAARAKAPVKSYRVDTESKGAKSAFENRPSPGMSSGSGPVGPLFVAGAWWLRRKKAAAAAAEQSQG